MGGFGGTRDVAEKLAREATTKQSAQETYGEYWSRLRRELREAQDDISARYAAGVLGANAAWLEQRIKDFDDANLVSETELQLLIKFAEWVKEGR
jgi:hypothetical protein